MGITAKEVAKIVGVSEATLSLVINGKPGISDKTRVKVIRRLQELGYSYMIKEAVFSEERASDEKAKTLAFVLFKNRGELLGMNSFFPLILDGVETTARKYGYSVHVISVEAEEIEEQISYITESGCRGFVVFATELHEEALAHFDAVGLPYVLLDNYFINRNICTVKVNNQQGIYQALRYLQEMGHHKVGYLSSGLDINSFHERQMMAWTLADQLGFEDMREYSYHVGYPNETAEAGMTRILQDQGAVDLPTAFLADNDLVAAGAMRAVQRAGIRVPEDISFVGFDDRPICTWIMPALTTIQLPREQFGGIAVSHLINMLDFNGGSCIVTAINGTLVERESVQRLKG